MRLPSLDELLGEPLLAPLAVVETTLTLLARTLRGTYPEVDRPPRSDDHPETAAARHILDGADALLHALDRFRDRLAQRGQRHFCEPDWPF